MRLRNTTIGNFSIPPAAGVHTNSNYKYSRGPYSTTLSLSTAEMATEAPTGDVVDPLSGLHGPMLFPRTIRACADVPFPENAKDLESIHSFMKSLELTSPEKVMNEAKRIVDGGAQFLESNLRRFTENVGMTDAIAAKGKDRPQERRPGLGHARKRAQFSLRTSNSQPSVSLEPTLNIDSLQDPDEFFNAYERMENAKKEIEKQLGGNMEYIKNYEPLNNARRHRRREGILGKSYNYKHKYSSQPTENDTLTLSSEMVNQDVTNAPNDQSQEKLKHPEPIPDTDVEKVKLAASMKKAENEVSGILEELLSCNNEDLEGDGALNLLQERLKIKPLDLENLYPTKLSGVKRTSTFTVTEHDLENTNIPTATECQKKNRKTSPVFGSVLKILSQKSVDPAQVTSSLNPASQTPPRSPFASISSLQRRILHPYPLRDPFSPTNVDLSTCQNASPAQPKNKLLGQVEPAKDLGPSNEMESCVEVDNRVPVVSNMDAQEEIGHEDSLPEQLVDENVGIKSKKVECRQNEESANIEETMNIEKMTDNSNPSALENEARDDPSSRTQTDSEQQPEVHKSKPPKERKVAGEKRIRKTHPMRKSLAEAGTSFESGVRRSKRIKMRPLEYWKGERFLYGRVNDSLKLIGVKYISPGKDNEKLKVKPYIPSDSSEYKELLELAARH